MEFIPTVGVVLSTTFSKFRIGANLREEEEEEEEETRVQAPQGGAAVVKGGVETSDFRKK